MTVMALQFKQVGNPLTLIAVFALESHDGHPHVETEARGSGEGWRTNEPVTANLGTTLNLRL